LIRVDEAQRLSGVVVDSLDQIQDARGLARDAYHSRTQFYRVFRANVEETPVAMHRRLLPCTRRTEFVTIPSPLGKLRAQASVQVFV
jgi:hypothetical protein